LAHPKDRQRVREAFTQDIRAAEHEGKIGRWLAFLTFPKRFLTKTSPLFEHRKRNPVKEDDEDIQEAHEKRCIDSAITLFKKRNLRKAVMTLLRDQQVPVPHAEVLERMRALHPSGQPVAPFHSVPSHLHLVEGQLVSKMKKLADNKAPSVSGWTEELLITVAESPTGLATLQEFILDIMNNEVPREAAVLVNLCRLVPICSPEEDGTRIKIRPIGVGESICRIACAMVLDKLRPTIADHFGDLQYAFVQGGADSIIHATRSELQNGWSFIQLDCKNAFNSVSREAIREALDDPKWKALHGIFDLQYSQDTGLILFDETGNHDAISSSAGVRQGDVGGPLYFCLSTQPILAKMKLRFPKVKGRAFMDDVILGSKSGDESSLVQCFRWLARELRNKVQICLNLAKTKAFGPAADLIAANIGCKSSPQGARVLGSWVGDDDAGKKFLSDQIERHVPFWNRMIQVPAEMGFALLSFCGNPRFNHIARTHVPDVCREAAVAFDKSVDRVLCHIAGVPECEVATFSQAITDLRMIPRKAGGLGVPRQEAILHAAYKASKDPGGPSQNELLKPMIDQATSRIDDDTRMRALRAANKKRHASLWLDGPQKESGAVDGRATMQNGIFGLALQFRCGYTPGHMVRKQTIACKCGFTCSSNQFDAHLLGCAKYPGNHVAARHNAVRDLVQHWCRERGLATKSEPMLSGGRADLLITNASRALVVDFAVCSTLAPSGPTADETAERKNRKYTPAPGTDFCAAVFEASGGFSNSACQFIKKLSELAEDDARSLRHQISRTLAFWNGLMLAHSRPRTEPDCLVARNNKHHAEEDRNEETGRQTRNVPNDLRNQKTPRSGFAARKRISRSGRDCP
jgi:hypothetical protein